MFNINSKEDFFNSKEKMVIHCDSEEKSNRLLKAFDKLGKKCYMMAKNFMAQ